MIVYCPDCEHRLIDCNDVWFCPECQMHVTPAALAIWTGMEILAVARELAELLP